MKTTKILLAGLAGGVIFFLLGWLIYGILLMDFGTVNYNQCAQRPMEEMIWWSLILAYLAYGFLLALIFSWSKSKGILAGLKIGAIVGLLISVSMDLSMYSMSTTFLTFTAVIVDIAVYTFISAISGLVTGLIFGTGKKTNNE
jgi:hypothetical protein